MANTKISALTSATTPLAGTEVLPIVQSSSTVKVSVSNLTVARDVALKTVTATAAATQDGVALAGRAGGTSSYIATITPTTLSASRTVTLPNANTSIPVATQTLTFSGPTAARTITLPDANFTAARTDAAQSFTGDQTLSTGNAVIGTAGKGVTTGSSISLGLGTNGSTTQATIDTSGNFFAASASGTTQNGNFSNGGQLAALATNTTARSFTSIYKYSATNNATVSVWIGRDAGGNVFGDGFLVGHFYVYVKGASGANAFAGVYAIQTTGDGTTAATLTAVSSVTRGTSPVSSVQIANDGVNGAIKLNITYINNSGVVTGGGSTVTFVGQIA